MALNGRVGQVLGPFDSTDLLSENGAISQYTPETTRPVIEKLGIQTTAGTEVIINGSKIRIGRTGTYELDGVVAIRSLIFPNGADSDTAVDFIY